jgi:hypothetical protein
MKGVEKQMEMSARNYGKRVCEAVVLTVCLVIMPMSNAIASAVDPGLNRPRPDDADFTPLLGTYTYKVDFNNMRMGNIDLTIERENDLYKIQVYAQTINMFDRLYKIRYRGEAVIDSDPFNPVQTVVQQQVRTRERATTTTFQPGGTIKTLEKISDDGEVEYETKSFQPEKFMLDPFSATYLVRGFDWKVGTEKVFDVFPGKAQYELRLRCEKQVMLTMGGMRRPAWVIIPTAINLDPEKQAEAAKKPQANLKIYLSADDQKDVLKIEAVHMLGTLNVVMESFVPALYQGREAVAQAKEDDKTK